MGKTLDDKKVAKEIKRLNKQLFEDIFNTRFSCRQHKRSKGEDGIWYYMYELIDKEQPDRNKIVGWYNIYSIHNIWLDVNKFIVESDFWEKYRKAKTEGVI